MHMKHNFYSFEYISLETYMLQEFMNAQAAKRSHLLIGRRWVQAIIMICTIKTLLR